jgi:hypothetical protein
MRKPRVFTNAQEIDAFYEEMDQILRHVPKQFVTNVDETGCADFVDTRNVYVIVPATYPDDTIPIPVDRSIKRAALVGGIVAGSKALDPLVIVPRKTMEIELIAWGYGRSHIPFRYQENGFITTLVFEDWLTNVLIPYIVEERIKSDYTGTAVLL